MHSRQVLKNLFQKEKKTLRIRCCIELRVNAKIAIGAESWAKSWVIVVVVAAAAMSAKRVKQQEEKFDWRFTRNRERERVKYYAFACVCEIKTKEAMKKKRAHRVHRNGLTTGHRETQGNLLFFSFVCFVSFVCCVSLYIFFFFIWYYFVINKFSTKTKGYSRRKCCKHSTQNIIWILRLDAIDPCIFTASKF